MTLCATHGARGAGFWLGASSWIVLSLGIAANIALLGAPEGAAGREGVVVLQAIFFALLLARLIADASHRTGSGRLSLYFLLAGVGLWAAGSVTLSAAQSVAAVTFPAPGEVFFLASYVGIAGFLLLDVPRRAIPTAAVWLEAGVVCGAAACLAAFAVLMPLSGAFSREGLPLLLAILYPLVDVILGTMVLGQLMLRQRDRSVRTFTLMLGLLGLSAADSSLVLRLAVGSYASNIWLDAVWGLTFAGIVSAACARPSSRIPRPISNQNVGVLPFAAALAVLVLALRPDGVIGSFVIASALVTLVCTGARMMLALREAQGAAEAHRLSLTDELTGLPNRRALLAATDDALRTNAPLGLALLDLDGFKDVNDSLGHAVGDDVLSTLAHRMRAALATEVLVARLGGDEFALLTVGEDEIGLFEIAQRVRAVLQNPLRVESMDLALDASVGITVREVGDSSSTELLRRADIAMYEAKSSRVGVLLFDASQDGFSRQRLRRGKELREAIAEDQLVVWYQPQVDARTRRVVAMEALVRWQHPTEGLLAPITFLPDARLSGLMPALTEAVMRRAIADARRWIDEGFSFRIAMNCAPPELVGGVVLPMLFEALEQAGLPGECLLVEVTEDSFLAEPERAREALCTLRAHQVETSIDDYGTGFSSLAYLRDLPVQELKMDRSFVSTILTDERSLMIVQTTTQMAHALGLRLVAEGLEDAQTAAELITMGVDVFQGYQIAKPMAADDVAPWVRRWTAMGTADDVAGDDPEPDLSAGWAGPGRIQTKP